MTKHASFFTGISIPLVMLLSVHLLLPCGDPLPCPPNCPLPPSGQGTLNPNFELSFDAQNCSVNLLSTTLVEAGNVNNSLVQNGNLLASFDGGLTWQNVNLDGSVSLNSNFSNAGNCPLSLSNLNTQVVVEYTGTKTCECTPPVNAIAIQNMVNDARRHPLVASECRCANYVFEFPDGHKTPAFLASIELRLAQMNGVRYQVAKIDEELETVLLTTP